MVEKSYDWEDGAELEEHTKKKHQILREYFREYLITRCKLPQQEKFRLAARGKTAFGPVWSLAPAALDEEEI